MKVLFKEQSKSSREKLGELQVPRGGAQRKTGLVNSHNPVLDLGRVMAKRIGVSVYESLPQFWTPAVMLPSSLLARYSLAT